METQALNEEVIDKKINVPQHFCIFAIVSKDNVVSNLAFGWDNAKESAITEITNSYIDLLFKDREHLEKAKLFYDMCEVSLVQLCEIPIYLDGDTDLNFTKKELLHQFHYSEINEIFEARKMLEKENKKDEI